MAAARMLAYRRFFVAALSAKVLTDIHAALNTALVLGNAPFRAEVEKLSGQPQQLRRRGPRKKISDGPTNRG